MFACLLSLVPVLKVKVGWPCHTEAETRKKKSQEGGGDPKPKKQREGGEPREMLRY